MKYTIGSSAPSETIKKLREIKEILVEKGLASPNTPVEALRETVGEKVEEYEDQKQLLYEIRRILYEKGFANDDEDFHNLSDIIVNLNNGDGVKSYVAPIVSIDGDINNGILSGEELLEIILDSNTVIADFSNNNESTTYTLIGENQTSRIFGNIQDTFIHKIIVDTATGNWHKETIDIIDRKEMEKYVTEKHYVNFINVKDYGAKGDGETDDTAGIRSARDAAVLYKKPLLFPSGTYMLSGCVQLYSGMTVYGDKSTVLKKIPAVTKKITHHAVVGDTCVYVDNVDGLQVGQDVYIGSNNDYNDTVGYITAINADNNLISFEVYPRHNKDKKSGLNNDVEADDILSTSFPILCTFDKEEVYETIKIEKLTFDSNKQDGEPHATQLSPIFIDTNEVEVIIKECNVLNSNADGISLRNKKQTIIDSCTIEKTVNNGININFTSKNVSIIDCVICDCLNSGIYRNYNVNSLSISNCYFYNCCLGIDGIELISNSSNITGCTFEKCGKAIPLHSDTGGSSVVGCNFKKCDTAVEAYSSGNGTVSSCTFVNCKNVLLLKNAEQVIFKGNVIKNCEIPLKCEHNPSISNKNDFIIITDNIVKSTDQNCTSKFSFEFIDKVIVKNNILTGNEPVIEINTNSTTDMIINDNIADIIEI